MPTDGALRLLSWLTPAMPIGAFAWSGGLESAVREGAVADEGALGDWLEDLLARGALRLDAALALRAMGGEDVAPLALALAASPERRAETEEQGAAFAGAAAAWLGDAAPAPGPLPAVLGAAARAAGLEPRATAAAFLHAGVAGALQAALRLMPLGQSGAVRLLARLEPRIADAADALAADPAIAAASPGAEIAALRHGALPARLFRS